MNIPKLNIAGPQPVGFRWREMRISLGANNESKINMPTVTLGKTGIVTSRIGLGLAALGRPGYITMGHGQDLDNQREMGAMQARALDVLDAAYLSGVRYFDAARSYGLAEAFLMSWFKARGIPPASATVASKWGYTYTAGWKVEAEQHEVKEHSLPVLQRQWQESLAELGEHLSIYQIHSASKESGVLEQREVLRALARLRERGMIIGLTVSGAHQHEVLQQAMEIEVDGVPLFQCVQATWNLLEPSAQDVLTQAHARGMGVIVKEVLANGRLTRNNQDPAFNQQRMLLQEQAERMGATLDALAIAAALAQPWADVVLSGAARVAHLHSNLRALNVDWDPQAESDLAELREDPARYWDYRSQLAWN